MLLSRNDSHGGTGKGLLGDMGIQYRQPQTLRPANWSDSCPLAVTCRLARNVGVRQQQTAMSIRRYHHRSTPCSTRRERPHRTTAVMSEAILMQRWDHYRGRWTPNMISRPRVRSAHKKLEKWEKEDGPVCRGKLQHRRRGAGASNHRHRKCVMQNHSRRVVWPYPMFNRIVLIRG